MPHRSHGGGNAKSIFHSFPNEPVHAECLCDDGEEEDFEVAEVYDEDDESFCDAEEVLDDFDDVLLDEDTIEEIDLDNPSFCLKYGIAADEKQGDEDDPDKEEKDDAEDDRETGDKFWAFHWLIRMIGVCYSDLRKLDDMIINWNPRGTGNNPQEELSSEASTPFPVFSELCDVPYEERKPVQEGSAFADSMAFLTFNLRGARSGDGSSGENVLPAESLL